MSGEFDKGLDKLGELYGLMLDDCIAFDNRLTAIASLHSPDDNTTCEECGKPHPCPTLVAVDENPR
jgi:hypothetical protein